MGVYMDDNRNNWFSAITMMKDPARGVNTIRRQFVHMLNTHQREYLSTSQVQFDIEEYEKRGSDPTLLTWKWRVENLKKLNSPTSPKSTQYTNPFDAVFTQGMKDTSGIQDLLSGIQTTLREPGVTVRMTRDWN